jgi:hypothetical protein
LRTLEKYMPNTPDRAEAIALEACREVPSGAAYEECLLWTIAEIKHEEQVAADRADLLVIAALTASVVLMVALIYKRIAAGRLISG